MESITALLDSVSKRGTDDALFWDDRMWTYAELTKMIERWGEELTNRGISTGSVVGVLGDFSAGTISLFLALMRAKAIIVPFAKQAEQEVNRSISIAGVQALYRFEADDSWSFQEFPNATQSDLVDTFRGRGVPGLIVFSSGSTGEPKGILHDCERLARRFMDGRIGRRTVLFLMMDHLGGFNTFFAAFCQGGGAVCLSNRSPDAVCAAIVASGASLLPTTPTFLNLLIASKAYRGYDLSSIDLVTYGTEVMAERTLQELHQIFPNASFKQTYGLSETGTLRSKSKSDDSVWVKVGGPGFDVKVVDGILWVRADANMVGYLNAPSPFDKDGWLCTGDQVEVDGDYLRILGRTSDLINVGGQKVFPVEVENVLLAADGVAEATVFGVRHPIMGHVVHARVSLMTAETAQEASERLRRFCLQHIAKYKVPVRFEMVAPDEQRSARYKKMRKLQESSS